MMTRKVEEFRPRPAGWRCPSCKQWVREPISRACGQCRLAAARRHAAAAHPAPHDTRPLELR